ARHGARRSGPPSALELHQRRQGDAGALHPRGGVAGRVALGFWKIAAENPDHVALVDSEGVKVRAGDLFASANQVAHGLRALGLERGDTVAVVLPNSREVFEVYLAAMQIGLYYTPINFHLTAPEIAYI